MSLDVEREVRALEAELRAAGSPERSVAEKKYLKSRLDFHGVDAAAIRGAARTFKRQHYELPREELLALVEALWQTEWHDFHSVAIGLLEQYRDRLQPEDIEFTESLLRRCHTWDHVDWLSTKVAGAVVERYPETKPTLRRWANDDYFWVRRAALLALLDALRAGRGDFDLFAQLAAPMLEEREFFIRKAIGWVLREVSKERPALTSGFLQEHVDRVSGLTLREGAKYLPAEQREELLARYEGRRGRAARSVS